MNNNLLSVNPSTKRKESHLSDLTKIKKPENFKGAPV